MHGVFHMVLWEHVICGRRTVLGERGIHFGWHQKGRKSYGGKTIFEGVSDHRGHHGIVPLDRCHYNLQLARARVLAPLLQDFALAQKKKFQSKVSCIRLRVSTQDFSYYRLGPKPTSWIVHSRHKLVSTEWSEFNSDWRVLWLLVSNDQR